MSYLPFASVIMSPGHGLRRKGRARIKKPGTVSSPAAIDRQHFTPTAHQPPQPSVGTERQKVQEPPECTIKRAVLLPWPKRGRADRDKLFHLLHHLIGTQLVLTDRWPLNVTLSIAVDVTWGCYMIERFVACRCRRGSKLMLFLLHPTRVFFFIPGCHP